MPSLLSNTIHDDKSHFLHNDVRDDDVALMPFSSGTTGLPKGVELTHSNLTAQLSQIRFQVLIKDNRKPITVNFSNRVTY